MAKAVWNETVLAESDKVERVGKDIYFPPDSINRQYFKKSDLHTTCPWKGLASYYDIIVNGKKNTNAAWYYPEPKKGRIKHNKLCRVLERCKNRAAKMIIEEVIHRVLQNQNNNEWRS